MDCKLQSTESDKINFQIVLQLQATAYGACKLQSLNIFKMSNYIITLEPYKGRNSRFSCPACEKPNSFTRYIHTETNEYIGEKVGRCNREDKCGYHYKPKDFYEDNGKPTINYPSKFGNSTTKIFKKTNEEFSILSKDIIFDAQIPDKENNFFKFLKSLFDIEEAMRLRELYRLGSSEKWNGATIFYRIDKQEQYRTGKIMLYDVKNGRRIKEPYNHIAWVHNDLDEFKLKQCLFGEHLLANNNMPVAIVESEKTAVICSSFLEKFIWLSTGGKSNLTADMLKVLKDREVTLFPDLGAYKEWGDKMKNELSFIESIKIDDTLERHATGVLRENGSDLADFFIEYKMNQLKSAS
jgi:hypothetical protein